MTLETALFYVCVVLSLGASLVGFLALGDLVQLAVSFPRRFTYAVFRVRFLLIGLGGAAFVAALGLGIARRTWSGWGVWALALYALLFAVPFFAGYVAPTYLLFRTRRHGAKFVPVAALDGLLPGDAEALVVEVDGDARAYPHDWITRPHVVGDRVGGREVVMTYCALSHLGTAYDGSARQLDLKVMTQLENNLVLFDADTQEQIQQICNRTVGDGKPLPAIPSTVMPLASFRALYPQGKVFYNPPGGAFDRQVRGMMFGLLRKQLDPANPLPVFPTIHHADPRVPAKEQVYGIELDGRAVAYTLGYLDRQGGTVCETLGGTEITVKHFPQHGFVDVFYGRVPEVDPHGFAGGVRQRRVPHANKVLWLIWANFYRATEARV